MPPVVAVIADTVGLALLAAVVYLVLTAT